MGIVAGIVSMLLWGVAIFLAALVSRKIGNILTLFWMQLFGMLVGMIYFVFNLQTYSFAAIPQFIPILFVIAVLQILAYLFFYKGLERGQVSMVSTLGASWGLVAALLGVVFFHEILQSTQLLAIALIIIGILLLSIDVRSLFASRKVTLMVGVQEGVVAMLGWGISLFLLAYPTRNLDWFMPAFLFRIILVLLLAGYMMYKKKSFIPKKAPFPLTQLMAIGAFDMGAFMAFSFGLSSANASIVAPIGSAYAVVTLILAKIFLKEKIAPVKAVGIAGIVAGLVLISL